MNLNTTLLKSYLKAKKELASVEHLHHKPAHPFLLSVPNDYDKKFKVMIFGQETNDWLNFHCVEPQTAMESYRNFWINKQSKNSKKGVFLQILNNFQNNMLNPEKVSCIWNNTIKIGSTKSGTPSKEIIEWQKNWFSVVQEEVQILKPDFIIFLTGPKYDKYIKEIFGKFSLSPVLNKKKRQIAKLNFTADRKLVVFRTYHPQYLRRSKLEKEILIFLQQQIDMNIIMNSKSHTNKK
jgi:hypothetical protein